ncbi:MAG: N-acetylglucosamine-6-phosphate deacetylase [Candidatus Sumerlaeia bacterium]
MLITNVKAVTPTEILSDATIYIEDSLIDRVAPGPPEDNHPEPVLDGGGAWALPGFIDTHCHGAAGADTTDRIPEALKKITEYHLRHGTTSMLLTAFAQKGPFLLDDIRAMVEFIRHHNERNQWLGIHIEGPFLNPNKPGMFDRDGLLAPNRRLLMDLIRAADKEARLMTIAPELKGALEFVSVLVEHDIRASLGHTEADLDVVHKAVRRGLSHVTHLYNAMPAIHHRNPGTAVAAILESSLFLELIVDGIHVHPEMVKFTVQAAGAGRIVLVTDAQRGTGMPDGRYRLGRQGEVEVKDGAIRGDNGALAGSTLTMAAALRNLMRFTSCSMVEGAWMASTNAAQNLGIDDHKGRLTAGYDADIVLMDEQLRVTHVICMGRVVNPSESALVQS